MQQAMLTISEPPNALEPQTRSLPRRDYILLPLISLVTVLLVLAVGEFGARILYPVNTLDSCLLHDPVLGVRFQPDCSSRIKLPETDWVSNRYNACGYRSDAPCGPKPADTLRVALIGSSIAFGMYVPYQDSIGAVVAKDLTAACGQPVEVQNLASEYVFWDLLYQRFKLALTLKPDAVVVVAGPTDVMYANDRIDQHLDAPKPELLTRIRNVFGDLRLRVVAQHVLYGDADFYLSLYRNSVVKTLYMRNPLGDFVKAHLTAFENLLAKFHATQDGKPVPVLLAYVPQRAQVGFAASPNPPPGIDPYAMDRALAQVAAQAAVGYVDTTPDFVANPEQMDLFLRSDGHTAKRGDVVIGHSIARAMHTLPAFEHCAVSG